jgi:OOP family OmpA-OmpF porin
MMYPDLGISAFEANQRSPFMRRTAFFVILGLAASSTYAQDEPYGYLGGFVGSFDYEEDLSSVSAGSNFSDSTTSYRVYGGYRFSDRFSVEGSYGTTDDIEGSVPIFGFNAQVQAAYDFLGVNILGYIPFDKLSLFGGIGYWDADISVDLTVPGLGAASADDSDSGGMLTAGLQWELEALAIRAELDWFDTDSEVDASMIGIGVHWRF